MSSSTSFGSLLSLLTQVETAGADLVRDLPFTARQIKGEAEDPIERIRRAVGFQLLGMAQRANDPACRDRLNSTAACLDERLTAISDLANSDHIRPLRRIAVEKYGAPVPVEERPLRIGVYPLAANPLHWGHVLVGLTAMGIMGLDKIIFLIAGVDSRKPSMLSAVARHRLGRSAIEIFHPLFAYSSLALRTSLDGETNFERLLGLNSRQRIDAFYIAGADHYRRTTARGDPDTIQKLESIVEKQNKTTRGLHTISAVFLDREGIAEEQGKVATFLKVHVLPPVPLSFSSTSARQALCKEAFSEVLMSLPYFSLLEIQAGRFYVGKGECPADSESLA